MDRSCGVLCCDVLWSSESSEDSAVTCTHATYLGFVSSFKEFIWYQPLPVSECSSQCSAKACCLYMCVCVCVSVGCACKGVMSTTCLLPCCYTLVKLYHTLCTLLVAIVPHTVHAYPHSPTHGSSGICTPLNLLLVWVYVW